MTTTVIKEPQYIITVLITINVVFLAQRALQHSGPKDLEQADLKSFWKTTKFGAPLA